MKGGGKYSTYYNSVGYTNQDGVMKGTNYQRYTLQSKQDFKKGIFQAGTNVVLTYDQSNPLYSVIRGGMVGHTLQAIRHGNNMMKPDRWIWWLVRRRCEFDSSVRYGGR